MNKKGLFLSFPTDLIAIFILVLGFVFWLIIFMFIKTGVVSEIGEETGYVKDTNIVNIFKTRANNINLGEMLGKSYLEDDYSEVQAEIDKILNYVYGRAAKVCWLLAIENDIKIKVKCKTELEEPLLDSSLLMPIYYSNNKKIIDVNLKVPGYAEK